MPHVAICGACLFYYMRLGVTGHRSFVDTDETRRMRIWDILRGADVVYTGMALGFDRYIAEVCYENGIPFVACIPFEGQEAMWHEADKQRYRTLLDAAQKVMYVCVGGYANWKYLKRNEYIVDNTDMMLAYWDSKPSGGTYHCISYAKTRGKKVINVY